MEITKRFRVEEPSATGEARRTARSTAASIGFDEAGAERAALIATELGTNLAKHAQNRGELLLISRPHAEPPEIDVIALDPGPGTDDVSAWLRDGFSTSGSPGTGLGAVSRVADTFDVHSSRDRGTAVLARIRASGGAAARPPVAVRGFALAVEGEEECGDAWYARQVDGRLAIVVADGLGHGPDAAVAARAAVEVFRSAGAVEPARTLDEMTPAMRTTRGAAVAIALIDPAVAAVRYSGIGNIAAVIAGPEAQHALISHNGTVGHEAPRARELAYPFPADALLVLHSDGLRARWSLDEYPGLAWRDPALVAGVLYRDCYRGRDDVTVVVARVAPEAA